MRGLQFSGSYFDVGNGIGMALKGSGFAVPRANSVGIRFARDSLPEVRRVFPEALDEIEGMGMALRGSYKDILAMVLTNHVVTDDHSIAFSMGADVCAGRRTLLARNYNRHGRLSGEHMRIKVSPRSAFASLGNTDMPVVRQDGMNSEGLAIAGSTVHGGRVGPGISPTLLMRAVLDKCSGVDDAVRLLTGARHARAYNFVAADRSGKMALVEASPKGSSFKVFGKGSVVATNHFQSISANAVSDTVSRHRRISSLIRGSGTMDADSALKVLSDHKGALCEHSPSQYSTVWSSIFSTKDGSVTSTEGNPCSAKGKAYRI